MLRLQVDDAKAFIKHRVLEKVEAKEIPHQVGPRQRLPCRCEAFVMRGKPGPLFLLRTWLSFELLVHGCVTALVTACALAQVEIVRFRTDTTSVGKVIVERAATLDAAAVVRSAQQVSLTWQHADSDSFSEDSHSSPSALLLACSCRATCLMPNVAHHSCNLTWKSLCVQVMAKHHKGAIATFLVGSATTYVAQHCKQPVVVLH